MTNIDTLDQLARGCRVEHISPFGLRITARETRDVRALSPRFLERLLNAESLVLFRGFEAMSRENFLEFCSAKPSSKLLHWDFGPVMEMKEQPNAKNYLFSREKVPFHWDGAFHQVPSHLVFHCVEAPVHGGGGETLFTDTTLMWRRAHVRERARWSRIQLTYTTEKVAHYGGRITVPMVQHHPRLPKMTLRYAEPVESRLNPVFLDVEGAVDDDREAFVTKMGRRLYDPEVCYSHRWEPGDLLFADNHSLIHGRNAYTVDSPRHLRRIQIL